MNILFLGSSHNPLVKFLQDREAQVIVMEDKIVLPRDQSMLDKTDFVVSFGYRHIVKPEVINQFQNLHPHRSQWNQSKVPSRIINLHISLLPYNRGADPNIWSWIEGSPKGVTIHELEKGLDTGDILCQKDLTDDFHQQLSNSDSPPTLASTYQQLQNEIIQLFQENWDQLKTQNITPVPQDHTLVTSHLSRQKLPIMEQLPNGWNTTIAYLISNFSKIRTSSQN